MSAKLATLPISARRAAAARLRRARAAIGWSQERAARELGIGVRTLRDMELGRARMTALEALCTLEARHAQAAPTVVDAAREPLPITPTATEGPRRTTPTSESAALEDPAATTRRAA